MQAPKGRRVNSLIFPILVWQLRATNAATAAFIPGAQRHSGGNRPRRGCLRTATLVL